VTPNDAISNRPGRRNPVDQHPIGNRREIGDIDAVAHPVGIGVGTDRTDHIPADRLDRSAEHEIAFELDREIGKKRSREGASAIGKTQSGEPAAIDREIDRWMLREIRADVDAADRDDGFPGHQLTP
jgi:hypothetical protein